MYERLLDLSTVRVQMKNEERDDGRTDGLRLESLRRTELKAKLLTCCLFYRKPAFIRLYMDLIIFI